MTKKPKEIVCTECKKDNSFEKSIEFEEKTKNPIKALFIKDVVIAEEINETRELYDKTRYGEPLENKTFQYSLHEAFYLLERGKFVIFNLKGKEITSKEFLKTALKTEPDFWVRYSVYKDLRKRGYIVKTALKFGADFRVYDRGVKPGEDHAKWIVYPVSEAATLKWHGFTAMNRVAHSTKKRLLIGIVDSEGETTYYEANWLRP